MERRGRISNKAIDCEAVCPFYHSETAKGIRCEGVLTPVMISEFPSKELKEAHETRYCVKIEGYKKCAVYRCVSITKYSED